MKELIQIQSELKAPKNQFNAFGKYKYRSCEDILEALKPLLLKYGCTLTIHDEVKEVAGIPFIESTASINKGDEVMSVSAQAGIDIDRKGMDIAQSFGASSSYARKYSLNGLFLIDDSALDPDSSNDHSPKQPKKLEVLQKGTDNWTRVLKYVVDNKSKGLTYIGQQLTSKYEISDELKKEIAKACNQ
jgi:ERF superfamily